MNRKTKINFNLAEADMVRLPHSERIEQEVLGCVLLFTVNYSRVYKYLKAEGVFYTPESVEVWAEIQKRIKPGVDTLYDTVSNHFKAIGRNDIVAWMRVCYMEAVSDARIVEKCLILNEYWITRAIHRLGYHLNLSALKRDKDKLELLGEASEGLALIYEHIAGMKEKAIDEDADELTDDLIAISIDPTKIPGVRSSLPELNYAIKGYRNGNLIIVGASTGEGKTTLAIQDALYSAECNTVTGYLSLEMKTTELLLMMACCKLGMDAERALEGKLTEAEMKALLGTISYIKKLPLMINDQPAQRIGEIKATARLWHKKGLKMLFVDHLHLANTDTNSPTTEQQYTIIANQLKELAKELDIPIIALAQLARKDDKEKRPHQVTDLKYAGGIEQAADVVLLIFRPEHHGIETNPVGESTKGYARIIVAKVRMIRKRNVTAYFSGQRFIDWDEYRHNGSVPPQAAPERPFAGMQNRNLIPITRTTESDEEMPF